MRYKFSSLLLLLLMLLLPPLCRAEPPAPSGGYFRGTPKVTQIRWAIHTDAVTGVKSLRIVLDATGPVQAAGTVTATPSPCLVVDIGGAVPAKTAQDTVLDGTIATRVGICAAGGKASRLVIELPQAIGAGDYKVFTLRRDPQTQKPFRVVVDINKAALPPAAFTPGLKGKVIVLDPGHGGSDPGAIGPGGSQEKTVTLAVALKVRDLLQASGAKVIMTRTDDRDVFGPNASDNDELGARVDVGNKNKADVLVDIHVNSFGSPAVGGTGTYYFTKSDNDRLLAKSIQDSVVSAAGLNDRGVYSANFVVLKYTTMPAALIELGFISNPDEEKLLIAPVFQQKLAQGIVSGLSDFFRLAAPGGS